MLLKLMKTLTVVMILLNLAMRTSSHVALKYPPARKYDLDFLDSFRTTGSCGMNAGTERTQLRVNQQINVTWHLGYPHGGGIKLQILRDGEEPVDLTSDWESGDRYQQSSLVTLPSQPCQDCTLLLLRQATEWGGRYQFRSCSDISLVTGEVDRPCGKNGQLTAGGGCSCETGYSGDRCQYKSACTSDADCGQGKCELMSNSLFEEKECFCESGSYGPRCEKKNSWSDARNYDASRYEKVELSNPDDVIMWRVEDDLVEVVAEMKTQSWLAVGWRPADSQKTCQRFPEDAPAPRGTDFHAMDCTDMVIGFSKNGRGKVGDYYTRDRSTPRVDSFWGGEDDLMSGDVWEVDGKTVLRFSKKIDSATADHAFQGKLHMIWATGQQEDEFYRNDQLKYHGRQRGIVSIDGPEPEYQSMHPAIIGLIIAMVLLGVLSIFQAVVKCVFD